MIFTAAAFVALMVFEWGMDMSGQSGGGGSLGRVDGTSVSMEQYQTAYRNLYDQVSRSQEEPISSQQNREIEDAAWDEVVNQILISKELDRRGIRVTNEEVRQAARFSPPQELRQNPAFRTDGEFDLQKYQAFLASPQADDQLLSQLETYYRDVIPRSKLLRQVTSGIYIPDTRLWQAYRDQNEEVSVRFIPLNPAERIANADVPVTADEVSRHYRANREDFAVPARAEIRIAVLSKAPMAQDTVAAFERVQELRREILGGASFSEVAERESADPGSAMAGGDLGTFTRGQMVGPFDEVAFNAPIGQLSEPVETSFGYHLIEVTSRSGDSAEARHILIPIERTDDSEIQLLTMADSLETLTETRSLEDAASELGIRVQTVEITRDYPFVPQAGQIGEGADWIFIDDEGVGVPSPVFETRQAFYALEVIRADEAGYLPLAEATPAIEETIRREKKIARVVQEGEGYLLALRNEGLSLAAIADRNNLEIRSPEPFTREDFVPGLGRQNAAIGAAFGLSQGAVSDVVTTRTNAFIIELVSHQPADSAAWLEQKDVQRAIMTNTERQQRLEQWLDGLREIASITDRRAEVFRAAEESAGRPQMPMVF